MENLAKLHTVLHRSPDDIAGIPLGQSPTEEEFLKEVFLHYRISPATAKNWKKLDLEASNRLISRANKRNSKRRILPIEYFSNKNNIVFVQTILDYIEKNKSNILSVIFSMGINLLKRAGIYGCQHVGTVLSEYTNIPIINELETFYMPEDEFDILGLLYQSYLQEGTKNIAGSYYTPQKIAHLMTKDFVFLDGQTFFDPCCGSGSFLLSVDAKNPNQIYGVDKDKIAVLIAKINLLLKYKDFDFSPQIYCFDFLMLYPTVHQYSILKRKFDYIATNPPWGAMEEDYRVMYSISSKESFSYFFIKSFGQLKSDGIIRFLFPEAILNVKAHKDIRKFILDCAGLTSITMYRDMFSGVTTRFIDIECQMGTKNDRFIFVLDDKKRSIDKKIIYKTKNYTFTLLSDQDIAIIQIFKDRGQYSLQDSTWALGIVTGDNKGKLSLKCLVGMEKIYTGKEIQPYTLKPARNYILYNRDNLQQVAKEEIYRAPEKLVYKFISSKLIFAYDNSASLFLNSANILIPKIPSLSIKTVMAFLNSSLFQYIYIKLFGEPKILKGNLIQLKFPEISETENAKLTMLVDEILSGDISKQEAVEKYIFSIYGLTSNQITYIRSVVNGKAY